MRKRMGVLGPRGTHSEAAGAYLSSLMGEPPELVMSPDIYDCLLSVEEGAVDFALVPVENSLEGAINITLDTLAETENLTIEGELIWPVHNYLMGKCAADAVTRIYSHPQPIAQCRDFLREHYSEAEIMKTSSTARAAELVGEEPEFLGWAAICPKRAGDLYGLRTLAGDIQDNMNNCTRFFVVQKDTAPHALILGGQPLTEKVLVIAQIDGHRPGALYEVLGEFASRRVNMTRIESRPARTELGAYIFFFDLDSGSASENDLQESIEAVSKKSIWLKKLGPFPVLSAREG